MRSRIKRYDFLDKLEVLQAVDYEENFPPHFHDTICLTLVNQGVECTNHNDLELITPCRGISMTPQNEVHSNPNKNNGPYSFLTYYISPDVFNHGRTSNKKYELKDRVVQDEKLYNLLMLFASKEQSSEEEFINIIEYIFQRHVVNQDEIAENAKGISSEIQETVAYIDENLNDSISIETLSRIADTSKYSFIRTFKKNKGITPGQYIILKRIEKAKQILQKENSIADAVFRSGFFDQSHMTRNFKKFVGTTPKEYLKARNIIQDF